MLLHTVLAAALLAGSVRPARPALQSSAPGPPPSERLATSAPDGYGPWRLGMTRAEVRSYSQFGPYKAVAETNGLETANGRFADRKTTLSFVFGAKGRLEKIQVWAYEGKDDFEAVHAWHSVYRFLEETRGPVNARGVALPEHSDLEAFSTAVRTSLAAVPLKQMIRLQLAPLQRSKSVDVFSSLFRHPMFGFYVFLYFQSPQAPGSEPTKPLPPPRPAPLPAK